MLVSKYCDRRKFFAFTLPLPYKIMARLKAAPYEWTDGRLFRRFAPLWRFTTFLFAVLRRFTALSRRPLLGRTCRLLTLPVLELALFVALLLRALGLHWRRSSDRGI